MLHRQYCSWMTPFITGTRISSYQKNLRDFSFSGAFHYLVAISRPEENRIWDDQRLAFIRARATRSDDDGGHAPENIFDYVEKLVLPNWTEDRCPWCAEKEKIAQMREAQHATPMSSAAEGMDQDIFVVPKGYSSLELKKIPSWAHQALRSQTSFALSSAPCKCCERNESTKLRYSMINTSLSSLY